MEPDAIACAIAYHHRTKHHLHRYASSPGYLDWDTQPDPFRTYDGAPVIELALAADGVRSSYADLYGPGAVPAADLDLDAISAFFELALGLSAWKEYRGSRWALRCDPSSGNLHPTEGYLICGPLPGLEAGVYHYVSRDHVLEHRAAMPPFSCDVLARTLGDRAFLVGVSSIHWREAWKYGERAFRYCQHDAGHVVATVRYAAAAHGWRAVLWEDPPDDARARLMGIDRDGDFARVAPDDREHPDALVLVDAGEGVTGRLERLAEGSGALLAAVSDATWRGRASALSSAHVAWPVIDEVARATWKKGSGPVSAACPGETAPVSGSGPAGPAGGLRPPSGSTPAARLIRARRSAVSLDGRTSIAADELYGMLDRLLPRPDVPPWDVLPWAPHVHAGLFVHRVRGLDAGLYLLERSDTVHERLLRSFRSPFEWCRPAGTPDHLRFFRLLSADTRNASRVVSCHQAIAADGAFSLGMLADFSGSVRAHGAWWYRRLFWEAGVLGQVLYLEAEAAGVRGTGIGCYFDDAFHEIFDLADDEFQSLYHFTVGGPVEDSRLATHPPYAHLGERRRAAPGAVRTGAAGA
jgi:SagB-type dehydrogenase family enzyme